MMTPKAVELRRTIRIRCLPNPAGARFESALLRNANQTMDHATLVRLNTANAGRQPNESTNAVMINAPDAMPNGIPAPMNAVTIARLSRGKIEYAE